MPRLVVQLVSLGGRMRTRWLPVAISILAIAFITACGDSDDPTVQEDRRFATDPEPAPTETIDLSTPTVTSTAVAVVPTSPPASPEATPLPIASQVEAIVGVLDGNVVVINVATGAQRVVARSSELGDLELTIADAQASKIAIVVRPPEQPDTFDLHLFDFEGTSLGSWTDVESTLSDGGTKSRGSLALDWDARGERVAIVFPNGGGIVVDLNGSTNVLLTRQQAPAPLSVAWSPDDEAIAFTSRDLDDDSPYLAIGGARVLPLDPVRIAGTGGSRPIHAIAWHPDGETLFAVQGSSEQGDEFGGDLIQIDRRTLAARFALGGSRFGPGAEIVSIVSSPSGTSWGIVSVAPGRSGGLEATVWGATGEMTNVVRLDLGENPPVAGIVWTASGITVTLMENGHLRLASFSPEGEPVIVATPAASPEPMASPADVPPIVVSPQAASSPDV